MSINSINIVCHDITAKGGIERVSTLLANLFSEHGLPVSIYSIYKEFENTTFNLNDNIKVNFSNGGPFPNNIIKKTYLTLKSAIKLKKSIKINNDIIIAQSIRCALICWLAGIGKNTIVCEHFKYGMYGKILTKFRNYVYRKLKCVITLTNTDRNQFIGVGINAQTIPNMCSFKVLKESQTLKSHTMVCVGRLNYQKGFDLLLQALPPVFNKYPNWELEIYGEGEEKEQLEGLLKSLNLNDNVKLKGYSTNVSEILYRSSFFILSSRYEGFPMCLVEAIAHRLPIISFDCPEGPSELLRNDGGLLIENGNIPALTEGIMYMIENPDKRMEYTINSLRNIESLAPEKIYRKWIHTFKDLGYNITQNNYRNA